MSTKYHEDLTAFQRDLLEAIARIDRRDETPYGLGIARELETDYDEVLHPRLYSNLDDLTTMGLVERSAVDNRTNRYDLTGDGRALLQERVETLARSLGHRLDGGAAP
jgi:DNA-binding PadR family transcriptional regulator